MDIAVGTQMSCGDQGRRVRSSPTEWWVKRMGARAPSAPGLLLVGGKLPMGSEDTSVRPEASCEGIMALPGMLRELY
jgi:hypothetical protein